MASTGVIGVPLPMERVEPGIADAADKLSPGAFGDFARAILTTDESAKLAEREVAGTRLVGCTKGAGMIAPDMATTLTFVATDAAVAPAVLKRLLGEACAATYNAIAVDGDTSTNDMILVMASGAGPRVRAGALGEALADLLGDLARQLMRGGEGVHHVVTIEVRGAESVPAARKVARAIAVSPLVKTAIAGADPNFGRILAAAGNAGVPLRRRPARPRSRRRRHRARRRPGRRSGARGGRPRRDAEGGVRRSRVDLGLGSARAHYLACDLSHDYVSINADYRT